MSTCGRTSSGDTPRGGRRRKGALVENARGADRGEIWNSITSTPKAKSWRSPASGRRQRRGSGKRSKSASFFVGPAILGNPSRMLAAHQDENPMERGGRLGTASRHAGLAGILGMPIKTTGERDLEEAIMVEVAQMDRVPACEAGRCGIIPRPLPHLRPVAKTERHPPAKRPMRRFDSGRDVHRRLRSIVAMLPPFKRESKVRFLAEAPFRCLRKRPGSIVPMLSALNGESGVGFPAGAPSFAGSSSGRTPSFELVNPGSNPGPAATPERQERNDVA